MRRVVSAGIFVVSYPPGPEAGETRLLSTLGAHGISKMFFVVNIWGDLWRKKGARKEATDYVQELIDSAHHSGANINSDDRRVFGVNLGMAREEIGRAHV